MKSIDQFSSMLFAVVAFLLFGVCTGSPAAAQSQTPPTSLAPTEPGDLFSFTDVGALAGQYLEDSGMYLNLAYQDEFQANVVDGRNRGIGFTAEPSGGLDIDLQRMLGIPGAAFHIIFDDRIGRTISFTSATIAPLQALKIEALAKSFFTTLSLPCSIAG
jgi:carbohydrate-selective porin OprB